MYVQPTNSCQFSAKNTYLSQAEKALTRGDKNKFLSYHYEAKARNHYWKYLRASNQFDQIGSLNAFENLCKAVKLSVKAVYEKLASVNSIAESYKLNSERFESIH